MNRPRVAIVSPFIDNKHGTERHLVECIKRLNTEFEFHLYSQRVEDVPLDRVTWHRISSLSGPHLLSYLWWFIANQIQRWCDERNHGSAYDAVYSPGINCFDVDAVAVHVVFNEMRGRLRDSLRLWNNPLSSWPVVVHRRAYYTLISALENRIYSRPTLAVAVASQKVRRELAEHFHRTDAVEVIYTGIDTQSLSPEIRCQRRDACRKCFGLQDDPFVLLLIGNGWHNKGLECLLHALTEMGDSRAALLVVGNDDREPFQARATSLDLSSHIRFLAPSPDVVQFYAAADAYVGPSLYDSFSLPVAEAMACGLPAITSRIAGASELMQHDINGLILEDPSDFRALAAMLRDLMDDPALCARLGTNAAKSMLQYTWERNAAAMRDLFHRAIAGRRIR